MHKITAGHMTPESRGDYSPEMRAVDSLHPTKAEVIRNGWGDEGEADVAIDACQHTFELNDDQYQAWLSARARAQVEQ